MTDTQREAYEKECKLYGFEGKPLQWQNGFTKGFNEGYQAALAHSHKWISVEDKYPDDGVYVIAINVRNGDVWNWDKCRYSSTARRWMIGNNYAGDFNYWALPPITNRKDE